MFRILNEILNCLFLVEEAYPLRLALVRSLVLVIDSTKVRYDNRYR